MENCYFTYVITYIGLDDKQYTRKIKLQDLGFGGKNPTYQMLDINSSFNNEHNLTNFIMEKFREVRCNGKNESYKKRYEPRYTIKELVDFKMTVPWTLAGYGGRDEKEVIVPIMYQENFRNCKFSSIGKGDPEEYRVFDSVEDLMIPKNAFIKLIRDYMKRECSNNKDLAFKGTMLYNVEEFLTKTLDRVQDSLYGCEKNDRIRYGNVVRIDEIQTMKGSSKDYINAVLSSDGEILNVGSLNDFSIKYWVFISKFVHQLKANAVAHALDESNMFNYDFSKTDKLYYRGFSDKLVSRSASEVYEEMIQERENKDLEQTFEQYKRGIIQKQIAKEQEASVTKELFDYYRTRYPEYSDEDIMNIFIQPDNYSEDASEDYRRS